MGRFYSESFGETVYLVYETSEDERVDSFCAGMLVSSIPGVAKTVISQIDYTKYIKFDITSKIPVEDILDRPVNRKMTVGILSGIVRALIAADCFMLDTRYIYSNISCNDVVILCLPIEGNRKYVDLCKFFKSILFNMKYTDESDTYIGRLIGFLNSGTNFSLEKFAEFLDGLCSSTEKSKGTAAENIPAPPPSPKSVSNLSEHPTGKADNQEEKKPYIYMPNTNDTKKEPVKAAPKKHISWFYLMQHYNKENAALYKKQKEQKKAEKGKNVKAGSSSDSKPNSSPQITDFGFDIPGLAHADTAPPHEESKPDAEKVQKDVIHHSPVSKPIFGNSIQNSGDSADFGDTVFAGAADDDDTTRFDDRAGQSSSITPMLIRKRNNERIRIDSAVFRIGRKSGFNDYVVADNLGVGHVHCHIVSHDGEYFLVDDNSKNHTYLDGTQIPPSTEVKLSHGQKFRLSDEEFEFLLY